MALEIDLEAIQGSAKDAIKAQQTELNVALGAAGKPLIAVDGIVGPQTLQAIDDVAELGKEVVVDKNCPAGQHWDEGLQQCVDDEPAGTGDE
jgi:lysozyme family protein